MFSYFWRTRHRLSPSSDLDHISICAKRVQVSKLRTFLSNPKPDLLLCSKQCGLLIEVMQKLAVWLARWERTALSAPFVEDLLTLATKGVRLIEDFVHVTPSSWLTRAASRMDSREEFEELFKGFLQGLLSYVEVMQGSFSHHNVNGPQLASFLQSRSLGSNNEVCMREAKSLIAELKKDFRFLRLQAAEDRRALFERLEQGNFREGEESKVAQLLMERLEHQQNQTEPFQLNLSGVMNQKSKLLGKGTCGEVFESTWMGMEVAVKQFDSQANLDGELKALRKTSHVNVMRAIAYHQEMGNGKLLGKSGLMMEQMKGDLGQFVLRIKGELPLSVSIEILLQIANGMAHLHAMNIMHRDLKPANVLFSRWPPMSTDELHKGPGDFTAKVTDFGECRTPACNTTHATVSRGTACYRAPEILLAVDDYGRARYSNKVDVYSFGMVCYKLLTRLEPLLSKDKVLQGDYSELQFPSTVPLVFKFLMRRCWARAHQKRPSFVEICDFLALLKSIFVNAEPSDSCMTPLRMGIGDDVRQKLEAFLGEEWLLQEAVSLGISPEFVQSLDRVDFDAVLLRLRVTNKLAAFHKRDCPRWVCCCGELAR